MKKVPKVSHKWWSKMFFPHLLATQAYRYVFRNRPSKIDPVKARKITDVLALGYVLLASTACGLGKFAKQIRGRIETKLVIRKKLGDFKSQTPTTTCNLAGSSIPSYPFIFTAYWIYQNSGASARSTESTATYYARLVARNVEDPETRIIRVNVFDGFKTEDITEEVREAKFGKVSEEHKDYDKYSDPAYIRKRLNVPEGSKQDEKFNVELAGVYLRRVDTDNKLMK